MFGSIGMFLNNYYPLLLLLTMMLFNIFAAFMAMVNLTVSDKDPLRAVVGGIEIKMNVTEFVTTLFGFTASQLMFTLMCSQIVFKIQAKTLRRHEYRRSLRN